MSTSSSWLTVRLADCALATLTQTQQSSRAEQKQLGRPSAVVERSTPLIAMTADYSLVPPRPSSAARLPSPLRYPQTVHGTHGTCRRFKSAAGDSSVGTRLSGYTAIFVFFLGFFSLPCPSPPTSPCSAAHHSGSNSLQLGQVLKLRVKKWICLSAACICGGLSLCCSSSELADSGMFCCGRWLGVFKEFGTAHAHWAPAGQCVAALGRWPEPDMRQM